MKEEKKYVLELPKELASGAVKGAGVAGIINTAFPALIPTFTAMYTGASNLSLAQKVGIGLGLSSAPSVQISNLAILGTGAIIGALISGTVVLVKKARSKSIEKKLTKKQDK
jgi:hypothetical protein